jgi:uncharacterized LabA/DUF88 family protein
LEDLPVLDLNNLRLAVLIDAENVPRKCIKRVMEEIAIYGTPTIKRIYGDWTNPSVSGWKASLLENAITPIQQYSYTTGKNSSDSAMIIDAMDILYSERTDGFVIVSSDSDFTRLAIRLREAGQRVIGIGEQKTPNAFIAACDKFTYIEVLGGTAAAEPLLPEADGAADSDDAQHAGEHTGDHTGDQAHDQAREQPQKDGDQLREKQQQPQHGQSRPKPMKVPENVVQFIATSIADIAGDDGTVFMGELGNLILKKQPDFDHRNYGYKSLSAMIKSIDRFNLEFRQTTDPNIKHVFVSDKEAV